MDLEKGHIQEEEKSDLWELRKNAFFEMVSLGENFTQKSNLSSKLKNLSLYMGNVSNTFFTNTAFSGIKYTKEHPVVIKEVVHIDSENWIIYIETHKKRECNIVIEQDMSDIKKFAVAYVNGQFYITAKGIKRVIALTKDFYTPFIGISLKELLSFMTNRYKTEPFALKDCGENAYLIDAPYELFGKPTVPFRDEDNVGVWISFGTLIKAELSNLSKINVDGVPLSIVESKNTSSDVTIKKLLSNISYGYSSIILDKKEFAKKVMQEGKSINFDSNKEDGTSICVDSILETLSSKGIMGLLYDEMDIVEEFPVYAYDKRQGAVIEKSKTVLLFKYKKEQIYMYLDDSSEQMVFMTYAGDEKLYENEKFQYEVKIRSSVWLTKLENIKEDNFVLYTGFGNLKHNKMLDIYFDNAEEAFSDLSNEFAVNVTEFDDKYREYTATPNTFPYNAKKTLIEAYGNNIVPLASGLIEYKFEKTDAYGNKFYNLQTQAHPMLSSFIDVKSKSLRILEPTIKASGLFKEDISKLYVDFFFEKYIDEKLFGEISSDSRTIRDWIVAGGFDYIISSAYYNNGWTLYKKDNNEYRLVQLEPVKIEYLSSESMAISCEAAAESLVDAGEKMLKSMSKTKVMEELSKMSKDKATSIVTKIYTRSEQIFSGFKTEVLKKNSLIPSVAKIADYDFSFKKHSENNNYFINNKPESELLNHAILYEDAFNEIQKKYADTFLPFNNEIKQELGLACPYFLNMVASVDGSKIKVDIASTMAVNVEKLESCKLGISVLGDLISRDDKIQIADELMFPTEAYTQQAKLTYLGNNEILADDYEIYRLEINRTYTQKAKKAFTRSVESSIRKISEGYNIDFDKERQLIQEQSGIGGEVELELPEIPTSQPIFIGIKGSKLVISLDGISYIVSDTSYGAKNLTARIALEDKENFIIALRTLALSNHNFTTYDMHLSGIYDDKDVYTVDVKSMHVDTGLFFSDHIFKVTVAYRVDDGQIVDKETGILYEKDAIFMKEYIIECIEYNIDNENAVARINIPLDYYVKIENRNILEETASSLMNNSATYETRLNLPCTLMFPGDGAAFSSKNSASQEGITSWFKFNGED